MDFLATTLLLGACAATVPPTPPRADADVGVERAFFDTYPAPLFLSLAAVCAGPGQSIVRPSANRLQCESLPDPESAAALILNYDGTITDLPRYVIGLQADPVASGFDVSTSYYIRVPQLSGRSVEVRLRDPALGREMRRTLQAAGGRLTDAG
tara:strand:+ start:166 stop:624 length:459 start_codon:yes stop_codon:yes gene_type:complete